MRTVSDLKKRRTELLWKIAQHKEASEKYDGKSDPLHHSLAYGIAVGTCESEIELLNWVLEVKDFDLDLEVFKVTKRGVGRG